MRRLALLLALLLLLAGSSARAEGPSTYSEVEKVFKEALKAEDPVARMRAFEVVAGCPDPRCVDLVVRALEDVRGQQMDIRKSQEQEEARYEDLLTKYEKLNAWFMTTSKTGRDLDRYNKEERKISRQRDAALLQLKKLENDFARTRSQIDGGVLAVGKVLQGLPRAALPGALATLETSWLGGRDPDGPLRWIDAVSPVRDPLVDERLKQVVGDETRAPELRGAVLSTLVERGDPDALELALAFLRAGPDGWALLVAGVHALEHLHDRRGIAPLIDLLQREDLKRLREDVHHALQSLTGQIHGPYYEPWHRWWEEQGASFPMPPEPVKDAGRREEQGGVTFYGIHTFSDRILFILDVSGSMDQTPKGGPDQGPQQPKIAVARRELIGAVESLDPGDRFNVIFFNHEVVPWQAKMVEASEANKRRARKWVEEQPPQGGTNIHDALEAGFRIATRTTGKPDVDTIFFLTDGKPTAGKIQEPPRILEEIRTWNRTANVRIHCVGIGDHDEAFMRTLAEIGGGTYVKR